MSFTLHAKPMQLHKKSGKIYNLCDRFLKNPLAFRKMTDTSAQESSAAEDADVDAEGSAMEEDIDVNDLKLEDTPQNEDKNAHVTEL